MPNINEINTAVYKVLKNDETLGELCDVYKGAKRPSRVQNPSVTVETRRLEPRGGEGIWMCDVVVTTYTDVLANRMPDHETLTTISSQICEVLTETEIELSGSKTLPLIEGESSGPNWEGVHDNEITQELTFGLIFIQFN